MGWGVDDRGTGYTSSRACATERSSNSAEVSAARDTDGATATRLAAVAESADEELTMVLSVYRDALVTNTRLKSLANGVNWAEAPGSRTRSQCTSERRAHRQHRDIGG